MKVGLGFEGAEIEPIQIPVPDPIPLGSGSDPGVNSLPLTGPDGCDQV